VARQSVRNPRGLLPAVTTGDTIYFTGQVANHREGNIVGEGDRKAQVAHLSILEIGPSRNQ